MYSSIYRVQSSTRRLPIWALFGFTLKLVESYPSPSPQSLCVVVCPWCQPWVASPAALKNKPLMSFGLGKRVQTGGCEQEMRQGSTLSSSPLESSRSSLSSVSRSESESVTSSEYMHTSIGSLHSSAANPLVVVSRSSISCCMTRLGLISPPFHFSPCAWPFWMHTY